MHISRRILLQRAGIGTSLLALPASPHRPVAVSTAVATPVGTRAPLLITAEALLTQPGADQMVATMPRRAFGAGHIPESIHLDWAELALADTSEASVASWTEAMRELVAVRGVRADRPIALYDEGSLFAARGWWQLAYLGYDLPVVLDGGLPAWEEAGGQVEAGEAGIMPVEAPLLTDAPVRRELLATKDEVLAALDDPRVVIVDVRSPQEYRAGHIPGAQNLPYIDTSVATSPPFFKAPDELREMYEGLGASPETRLITYCSTGVRGAVGFFAARLAGLERAALYVGSWDEWNADPETPKETS